MGVFRQPPQPAQLHGLAVALFPAAQVDSPPLALNVQQLWSTAYRTPAAMPPRQAVVVDVLDLYTADSAVGLGDLQQGMHAFYATFAYPRTRPALVAVLFPPPAGGASIVPIVTYYREHGIT